MGRMLRRGVPGCLDRGQVESWAQRARARSALSARRSCNPAYGRGRVRCVAHPVAYADVQTTPRLGA